METLAITVPKKNFLYKTKRHKIASNTTFNKIRFLKLCFNFKNITVRPLISRVCLQIADVSFKHYFPTSWVAFLSKLVASKIKPFNSDQDKIFSSCFFDLSSRFLFKSSPFSGGRAYGDDRPEKARKEPVNLGSSIGGIIFHASTEFH